MEAYKNKAREVKRLVESEKRNGVSVCINSASNPRTAWKATKNILGLSNSKSPKALISEKGEWLMDQKQIAKEFSNHLVNKVKELRNKISESPKIDPGERLKKWLKSRPEPLPQFSLNKINMIDLINIFKKYKPGKALGYDGIDGYSLKLASFFISDALLHIFNLSIEKGSFPALWKPQIIHPFHKKDDKLSASNYRPVSHVVETGKVMELIVHKQILDHFQEHKLFHPNHHGALPGHDVVTALEQIHQIQLHAAEDKKLTGTLLLDQKAAYDLVDHNIFKKKLKIYNFSENSLNWISSYLE